MQDAIYLVTLNYSVVNKGIVKPDNLHRESSWNVWRCEADTSSRSCDECVAYIYFVWETSPSLSCSTCTYKCYVEFRRRLYWLDSHWRVVQWW